MAKGDWVRLRVKRHKEGILKLYRNENYQFTKWLWAAARFGFY